MKAEKIKVWGVHSTDGYTNGPALAYYPIKAAAEGSPEAAKLGGYVSVQGYNAIRFDDVLYLFEKEIRADKIIGGGIPTYVPQIVYTEYDYSNGVDKSKYYVGDKELLKLLDGHKYHNVKKVAILRDDKDNYFVLSQPEPIELKKFLMSHEIAVAHALSKLTDEEKKLLGL